jgi:hypothetical protein
LSNASEKPKWTTGTLWGILAGFIVLGSVGMAAVVFGITGALAGQLWDLLAIPVGLIVGGLAFLFIAGILYRVDRYRGVTGRRVELFE